MKKLAAFSLFLILPMATGLSQTPVHGSPGFAPPKVICRPCGEAPPPKGYGCSNGVMIADSVPTSEIAKEAAVCNTGPPPKSASSPAKKSKQAAPCPKAPAN
jgi:hypothetical protein